MAEKLEIIVRARDVYGVTKYYPICERAHVLACLAGTKTLTDHAIVLIKQLGYTVTLEHRPMPGEL